MTHDYVERVVFDALAPGATTRASVRDRRTDGRTEDRTGERGDDGVSDDDARGAGGCRRRRPSATTIRNSNAKG